jgi:hypothetical protein
MLADNPFGYRQSETGADGRSVIRPPEPLEQVRQILSPDPRALIIHLQDDHTAFGSHQHADRPAGRAVPNRIVDQDGYELSET